jgi:hypothetical protein
MPTLPVVVIVWLLLGVHWGVCACSTPPNRIRVRTANIAIDKVERWRALNSVFFMMFFLFLLAEFLRAGSGLFSKQAVIESGDLKLFSYDVQRCAGLLRRPANLIRVKTVERIVGASSELARLGLNPRLCCREGV